MFCWQWMSDPVYWIWVKMSKGFCSPGEQGTRLKRVDDGTLFVSLFCLLFGNRHFAISLPGIHDCGGPAVRSDWRGWKVHHSSGPGGQAEPSLFPRSKPGPVHQGAGDQDSSCGSKLLCCHQVLSWLLSGEEALL